VKKVLTWIAIAIGGLWVIHNPAAAAGLIHQAAHAIAAISNNL
jgi:hypothetical protein